MSGGEELGSWAGFRQRKLRQTDKAAEDLDAREAGEKPQVNGAVVVCEQLSGEGDWVLAECQMGDGDRQVEDARAGEAELRVDDLQAGGGGEERPEEEVPVEQDWIRGGGEIELAGGVDELQELGICAESARGGSKAGSQCVEVEEWRGAEGEIEDMSVI